MFVNPLLFFFTCDHFNDHSTWKTTHAFAVQHGSSASLSLSKIILKISYLHFQICLFSSPHLSAEYSQRLLTFVICVVVDLLLLLLLLLLFIQVGMHKNK